MVTGPSPAESASDTMLLRPAIILFIAMVCTELGAFSACSLLKEPSRTPRTSIEQLLLTQALERSLKDVTNPLPEPAAIHLEVTGLSRLSSYAGRPGSTTEGVQYGPGTDLPFVLEAVASRLGELGSQIRQDPLEADYLVRIMVQALGTEQSQTFFGIPSAPSLILPVVPPEIPLYKAQYQQAHVRWLLNIYERSTGRFLRSTPMYTGDAYFNQFTIFFVSFRRTDLLEAP
jgi:hypothetical protein